MVCLYSYLVNQAPHNNSVTQSIALITLLVHDYDEAIAFFTQTLRFDLVQDTPVSADKRWVVVAPQYLNCTFMFDAANLNEVLTARLHDSAAVNAVSITPLYSWGLMRIGVVWSCCRSTTAGCGTSASGA